MTPEQREERLRKMRENQKKKLQNETPEQREERLKKHREYVKKKFQNKVPLFFYYLAYNLSFIHLRLN